MTEHFLIPDWTGAPENVGALTTTRSMQSRVLLRQLVPAEPVWLSQVHGVKVVNLDVYTDGIEGVHAPEADASIATQRGVVCVVQTADCLPVLLCDVQGKVVGAAHAGWRGLAGGVLENTVAAMREAGAGAGAGEILAWFGPAIGPERFEVGEDVVTAFVERCSNDQAAFKPLAGQPGKYLADIYQLARARLANAGVQRCYGGGFCTVTDAKRFYSYRRERITGRMASLIWLK